MIDAVNSRIDEIKKSGQQVKVRDIEDVIRESNVTLSAIFNKMFGDKVGLQMAENYEAVDEAVRGDIDFMMLQWVSQFGLDKEMVKTILTPKAADTEQPEAPTSPTGMGGGLSAGQIRAFVTDKNTTVEQIIGYLKTTGLYEQVPIIREALKGSDKLNEFNNALLSELAKLVAGAEDVVACYGNSLVIYKILRDAGFTKDQVKIKMASLDGYEHFWVEANIDGTVIVIDAFPQGNFNILNDNLDTWVALSDGIIVTPLEGKNSQYSKYYTNLKGVKVSEWDVEKEGQEGFMGMQYNYFMMSSPDMANLAKEIAKNLKAPAVKTPAISESAIAVLATLKDNIMLAGVDITVLPEEQLIKASKALEAGNSGILRKGQVVTIRIDGKEYKIEGKGSNIGKSLADAAPTEIRDIIAKAGVSGYEVGFKVIRLESGSLTIEVSDNAQIDIRDGKIVSTSVTRRFARGEDVVASLHTHLDEIKNIEEVSGDALASEKIKENLGLNEAIPEFILQNTARGIITSVLRQDRDSTGVYTLTPLGAGIKAVETGRISLNEAAAYGSVKIEKILEGVFEVTAVNYISVYANPALNKEVTITGGLVEDLLPPMTGPPQMPIGSIMPMGALEPEQKAKPQTSPDISAIDASGGKAMESMMGQLRKVMEARGTSAPVVLAFDAGSVIGANGNIVNKSFGDLVAQAKANEKIVKIAVIAWSEAEREKINNANIEGVTVIVASKSKTANLSDVIRNNIGKDNMSDTAIFLLDNKTGDGLGIVERNIKNIRSGEKLPAYAVLNQSKDKDVLVGEINLANLLASIAFKGAFVGIGYDENNKRVNGLAKYFGFFKIVSLEIAKNVERFLAAVKQVAASL